MTDLATLVVNLEAETSKYTAAITGATKQLKQFQEDVAEAAQDLATKFVALFTVDKIAEFIQGAVESAASLDKLSQAVGISVEQLSSLGFAAASTGVSQDELAASLKRLNVAISDAAGNATSKAAFAFQALGISVTNANGSLKTAGQLLPEIADAYQNLADGPNKVAINTDLLGKAAQNLIPVLNGGSAALAEYQKQADEAGITLSKDVADAADEVEKKFTLLSQTFKGGFGTDVLKEVLPVLGDFADGIENIGKAGSSTSVLLSTFADILKVIGAAILEIETEFKLLGSAIDGVEASFSAAGAGISKAFEAVTHLDFSGALSTLKSTSNKVLDILDDQSAQAQNIQKAGQAGITTILEDGGKKQIDLTKEIAESIKSTFAEAFGNLNSAGVSPALLQQLSEAQKKVSDFSDAIKAQAQSFNLGAAAETDFKLQTGALGAAIAAAQKSLSDMQSGVLPFNQALADSANKTLAAAAAARQYSAELQQKVDTKEIQAYTDKLQEQVLKIGQSDVAAIDFALTTGKLGKAFADAGINADAAKAHIHDLAVTLTDDKDKVALFNIDQQILTLGGHLADAAAKAFQFQNALLIKNVTATGDTAGKQQLDDLEKLQVAQAQYNELQVEFQRIQAQEALQEKAINDQVKDDQLTTLDAQAKIADARTSELQQLQGIYTQMQAISSANAQALPALVDKTNQAKGAITDLASATHDLASKLKNDFVSAFADSFTAFITGTESASQAFKNFAASILSELIKLQTQKLLESLLSGSTGDGGFFGALAGAISGGGKASGGPVQAGVSYTVGEHGAEEFVPNTDGTIVPNSKMQRGTTVYQTFVLPPGSTVSRATQQQVAAQAGGGISRATRRNT